jgi:hypothetical protein
MDQPNQTNARPRYTWPWFVLGLVVLGVVLAVIWMSVLVRRTREQRDMTAWPKPALSVPAQTNGPVVKTNTAPH